MRATSLDIVAILESGSVLGLVYTTNLFIGKEPADPKNTVTIFDTAGYPDEALLTGSGNGNAYQFPSVQIRIRNTKYTAGWQLAEDIKYQLHGRAQETWNGVLYSAITCSSGPALMDWDDNANARFIINFDIQRRAI